MRKIVLTLLIIILGLNILLTVSSYVPLFGIQSAKVISGSMIPGIDLNSVVVIKKGNYKVGDIVTYEKDSAYITHRVSKVEGNMITTKGDSNNTEDESIKESQIKGKVIYVIKEIYVQTLRISLLVLCIIYGLMQSKKG